MSKRFEDYTRPILTAIGEAEEDSQQEDWPWPSGQDVAGEENLVETNEDFYPDYDAAVSGEELEQLDGAVQEYGMEILAFYKSIHFRSRTPFPGRWGIFVWDWSVDYLARKIGPVFIKGDLDARELAWRFLREHELFHFRFDAWTLAQEDVQGSRLYVPYHRQVYRRLFPGAHCVEESLANKHAYDTRTLKRQVGGFMETFMMQQPPAYRGFRTPGRTLRAELAAQVFRCHHWTPGSPMPSQAPWLRFRRSGLLHAKNCPTHLIRRVRPSSVIPPLLLPASDELQRFVFKYLDGRPVRKTDHSHVKIDNGETVTIPNPHGKDRIKRSELRNIRLKAGMTSTEYLRERTRTRVWKRHVPRSDTKESLLRAGRGGISQAAAASTALGHKDEPCVPDVHRGTWPSLPAARVDGAVQDRQPPSPNASEGRVSSVGSRRPSLCWPLEPTEAATPTALQAKLGPE